MMVDRATDGQEKVGRQAVIEESMDDIGELSIAGNVVIIYLLFF